MRRGKISWSDPKSSLPQKRSAATLFSEPPRRKAESARKKRSRTREYASSALFFACSLRISIRRAPLSLSWLVIKNNQYFCHLIVLEKPRFCSGTISASNPLQLRFASALRIGCLPAMVLSFSLPIVKELRRRKRENRRGANPGEKDKGGLTAHYN